MATKSTPPFGDPGVEFPFRSKTLGEHQKKLSELARSDAEQLLSRAEYTPHGRYRSLFQTHLETAMMFLNKAITFDGVLDVPSTKENDDDGNTTEG